MMHLSTEVEGDIGMIRVCGDVDVLEAPKLDNAIAWMLDDGARSLVIDIRDVDFIASDGLRALIRAHKQTREHGGTVTIRRPSPLAYRLMQITALDTVLDFDGLPDSGNGRVG
jgi:anti-sigma B factor antagonist